MLILTLLLPTICRTFAQFNDHKLFEALFNDPGGDKELVPLSPEHVQNTAALEALLGSYIRSIPIDLPGGTGGADGDN